MKRFSLFLTFLLVLALLCACGKPAEPTVATTEATEEATTVSETTEETTVPETDPIETTGVPEAFVFPAGLVVYGTNLEGLTAEEGYAALSSKLGSYVLQVTVNDTTVRVSGSAMGLNYPESAFMADAEALAAGQDAAFDKTLRYSTSALRSALSNKLDLAAKNATIAYNKSIGKFVSMPEEPGHSTDLTQALEKASNVIPNLGKYVTATGEVTETTAQITQDSDAVKDALAKANEMIKLSLTYTYTPDGGETKTEAISKDTLASFISVNQKLNVSVSSSAVNSYAKKMDEKYQQGGSRGKFRTTGGGTVNLMVDYIGQGVNTDALAKDIRTCMESGISGTRVAPYLDAATCTSMPYNGTYIEVNLSAQYVWFYKNGELIVSSPIVSGCVKNGWRTPTGVWAVCQKFTNSWIAGNTAYVNYFMAYDGNYGLHDATWRSSFGGDIYLTNGSHGCTNMPLNAAATLYKNCAYGTKVIIYGGATSVDMITQEISGTDAYRVAADAAPFALDAVAVHGTEPLTYVSSDPTVLEVSDDGVVTVKGQGTATITVTCAENGYYTEATKTVTVEVYSPCEDGRHIYGEWLETKAPTCQPGEETFTCICGDVQTRPMDPVADHTVEQWTQTGTPSCGVAGEESGLCSTCETPLTRPVPALDHDFTTGGATCDRGCGAANPNYVPDSTESSVPEGNGEDPDPEA